LIERERERERKRERENERERERVDRERERQSRETELTERETTERETELTERVRERESLLRERVVPAIRALYMSPHTYSTHLYIHTLYTSTYTHYTPLHVSTYILSLHLSTHPQCIFDISPHACSGTSYGYINYIPHTIYISTNMLYTSHTYAVRASSPLYSTDLLIDTPARPSSIYLKQTKPSSKRVYRAVVQGILSPTSIDTPVRPSPHRYSGTSISS
jgi:hypothetical protein